MSIEEKIDDVKDEALKKAEEVKDEVEKKAGKLWKRFGRYVYIGVGILAFLAGAIWIGQWYATGEADKLAKAVHEKWTNEHRDKFQQIERNKMKIEELDSKFQSQIDDLSKRRAAGGKVIHETIDKGDTAVIAGMFDNLVDRYVPPASWDK